MKSKKAQITVFVILGLIILIAIGLFFAIKSYSVEDEPPAPELIVNENVASVGEFTDKCLQDLSKKAIKLVGEKGGYIDMPTGAIINPVFPYSSDIFYNNFYEIPYWYHMQQEYLFDTQRPNLCDYTGNCAIETFDPDAEYSIQENIENYINENLDECINDYKEFNDIFKITQIDERKINVQIVEERVVTRMEQTLEVYSYETGETTKLNEFYAEHNVPLHELYLLASEITEFEMNTSFIEERVLDLITTYSDVDKNMFPPMREIEFFELSGGEWWIKQNLIEDMRYGLLPFVGLIKIINAQNSYPPIAHVNETYAPFAQGFYNSMRVNIGDNQSYPYDVDIYYPDSEIDFYINNGEEILEPSPFPALDDNIMKMFKMIIQDYKFNYHLSFPVIVKIHDDYAFDGEGYDFVIALEANIRNNVPANSNMMRINFNSVSRINLDEARFLVNKTIIIRPKDKHTGEYLEDALISYDCGTEFFMGNSVKVGNIAEFSGELPYCAVGGNIIVSKEGYASAIIPYNNFENGVTSQVIQNVELWPFKEKHIYIWKRTLDDIDEIVYNGTSFFLARTELGDSDSAMFNINKVKENPKEDNIPLLGFQVISKVNNTNDLINIQEQRNNIQQLFDNGDITPAMYTEFMAELDGYEEDMTNEEIPAMNYTFDMIPGEYYVESTFMTTGDFTIPAATESYCPGVEILGVCTVEEEDIEYPELNFSTWVTGKSNFTTNYINENIIYGDMDLHFILLYIDTPTNWNQMQDYNLDELNEEYESFVGMYIQ